MIAMYKKTRCRVRASQSQKSSDIRTSEARLCSQLQLLPAASESAWMTSVSAV